MTGEARNSPSFGSDIISLNIVDSPMIESPLFKEEFYSRLTSVHLQAVEDCWKFYRAQSMAESGPAGGFQN